MGVLLSFEGRNSKILNSNSEFWNSEFIVGDISRVSPDRVSPDRGVSPDRVGKRRTMPYLFWENLFCRFID
jgi:hypothetical protein